VIVFCDYGGEVNCEKIIAEIEKRPAPPALCTPTAADG
jgi:hypothetical protein